LENLRVILSGGGTGGHIFPAVAIANEVKRLVPHAEILFVGALGRMEMEKVPSAGYRIIGVPIAGLVRRLTLANLKLPYLIVKSLLRTRQIIRDFKPHVVVGTGGYASGPVLRAATSAGIPVLLQEQNSYAGITNKILSKKASVICVAYEGMEKFFPREKIIMTGNPVRQDLKEVKSRRDEAIVFFKLDRTRKTVLVIGGSGGARTINEAIGEGLQKFELNNLQLIWQTGKHYFASVQAKTAGYKGGNVFVFEFISRMDLAYAAADIVISRAGASSVSELCNLGMASILVPSPNVAEDHQTKNAMALVSKNAALLVKDADAMTQLVDRTIELSFDLKAQEALRANIQKMAHEDSARIIAMEVLKLGGYKPA
jgi:UDP-N-acetylglucosamine--N-acetylmuramyl-(pentapeptide) pyrophosphoryl-undecaprenol N-acetylglucosamine transferase